MYPLLLTFAAAYPGLALGQIIVGILVLLKRHLLAPPGRQSSHELSGVSTLKRLKDRRMAVRVVYLLSVYVTGIIFILYSLLGLTLLLYLSGTLAIAVGLLGPFVAGYLRKSDRRRS